MYGLYPLAVVATCAVVQQCDVCASGASLGY